MDETKRDDAPKSPVTSAAEGSGSDTVSAAKISAGSSVGTDGQPARPHDLQGGASQGAAGQGSAGQGYGAASSGSSASRRPARMR